MENAALAIALNKDLQLELAEDISFGELKERLADYINHLINQDFQQLVMLLYRIDVSENKLRGLLNDKPNEDAGKMIAELIIERQLQKIKTRQAFKSNEKDSSEERW
ncbi:MAG: hypothetical protein JST58_18550 [Bacteroidetes bacterium]|nr:hypothetical protein [Bacteroidota bacterium]